ncbi:MAG TPA: ferrochelatase [Acidimicrobiales bacterium]|nr:ferrochelatase [Acidimicrobiales bacterium]
MSAVSPAGPAKGLVVMAYGTPSDPGEVEAYYTHIRRGRPPTPEQLADLERRYAAIGGVSPLAQRTRTQADAVAAALDRAEPGAWRMALGMKHAPPFVEDAVTELAKEGVGSIVGLVLAPHWSRGSVGEYHERAAATAVSLGADYAGIERWHDEPAWRAAIADRVRTGLAGLPERTKVLFTAHSLPERVLDGDPYPDELAASATAVAAEVGLDRGAGWSIAWQSAGRTPEPWRGPDILEVIAALGSGGEADGVLVCPQGFVSDHLEVLYDLDVDAARVAADAGLAFARTASINDDPAVMAALADRVRHAAI